MDEIEAGTTNARNSATDALLWLKRYCFPCLLQYVYKRVYLIFRAFEFVSSFLHEFGMGDKTLLDAVTKGYQQSLRKYHGMFARSVFSVSEIISSEC